MLASEPSRSGSASRCDAVICSSSPECPLHVSGSRSDPALADVPTLDDGQRRRFWQQWWHAANLLLPLPIVAVRRRRCGSNFVGRGAGLSNAGDMTPEWEAAMADVMPEAQRLLQVAMELEADCPTVGYELLDDADRVVAQAELAWPDRKVAVLIDDVGREIFEAAGWRVTVMGQERTATILPLAELGRRCRRQSGALSDDFLRAFAAIPRDRQQSVVKFMATFRQNPMSPESTTRRSRFDRPAHALGSDRHRLPGIVLKPDTGDVYCLLWVDKHDEAYDWARRHKVAIHPEVGTIQVLESSHGEAITSEEIVRLRKVCLQA